MLKLLLESRKKKKYTIVMIGCRAYSIARIKLRENGRERQRRKKKKGERISCKHALGKFKYLVRAQKRAASRIQNSKGDTLEIEIEISFRTWYARRKSLERSPTCAKHERYEVSIKCCKNIVRQDTQWKERKIERQTRRKKRKRE